MASAEQKPQVGIIMGSDSDLGVMQHVGRALTTFGLESNKDYEERVISAHRTPKRMMEYAERAEGRGLRVVVAGAGGSAHLPGMVASETLLPVLGVAVTSNPKIMNRAIGSMIGMPEGKPLASFQTAKGAYNAGCFAARIVAPRPEDSRRIAIVMGSDAESSTMSHAKRALEALGLKEGEDFEREVVDGGYDLEKYCQRIATRGVATVIASSVSGGLRLPRKFAEGTNLPVLGVTITDNPDSMTPGLAEIVNMGEGLPVAAFQGEAGAFNAGLFAARLLMPGNQELRAAYLRYGFNLEEEVLAKDQRLSELGAQAYLEAKKAN